MTLPTMSFIFGALLLAVGILGGGFEVKEVKVSNVTTTARILAGVVGAAFIVLGFWLPSLPTTSEPMRPTPPLAAASTTAKMSEREHDKNRFGGDYSSFDVATDRIEDCESKCKGEEQCVAWTYVKPGISRTNAVCWLKNVVPASSDNVCCVSGMKIR
ncbi:PAN domain-containing protein [Bradyrhizobium stylosanthis]|uniref:PAN domain-containing protein n=1 Tax=Bradyrhizobium stylosanthis TaxID=1803665 RepID=A0A560DRZ1_9BRAD|nr:PAN domain-containing protein [Bradyrhizobium stylosanthis]TWA99881.1 PAN domain-containing protein [Bradyrhizobium stylosanthis]